MIKKIFLTSLLTVGTFSMGNASQFTNNEYHAYKEIHTEELKNWYDNEKKMILIDARSKEYYDAILLPNAIWLPYDASEKTLKKTLPSKTALIVVYCWSPSCPASKLMADRLIATGYTNVYKYPEGLQEWMQEGFPTTKK